MNKKTLKILLCISLIVVIILSVSCNTQEKEEPSGLSMGSLEYPQFVYPASESMISKNQIIVDLKEDAKVKKDTLFNTEVPIYIASSRRQGDAFDEEILKTFKFDNYKSSNTGSLTTYDKDNETITIWSNGSFSYRKSYDTDRSDFAFYATREELLEKAKDFLSINGYLPDDFVPAEEVLESGVILFENGDEKEIITERGVMFNRIINGITVHGNTFISASFDTEGICHVSVAYRDLKEIQKVKLIGYSEAIDRIKHTTSCIDIETSELQSEIEKAVVMDVELVYYDYAKDDTPSYVQPCYLFKGIATDMDLNEIKFTVLVPALLEEYYKN